MMSIKKILHFADGGETDYMLGNDGEEEAQAYYEANPDIDDGNDNTTLSFEEMDRAAAEGEGKTYEEYMFENYGEDWQNEQNVDDASDPWIDGLVQNDDGTWTYGDQTYTLGEDGNWTASGGSSSDDKAAADEGAYPESTAIRTGRVTIDGKTYEKHSDGKYYGADGADADQMVNDWLKTNNNKVTKSPVVTDGSSKTATSGIISALKKADGSWDLDKLKKLIPAVGLGAAGLTALLNRGGGNNSTGIYNGPGPDLSAGNDAAYAQKIRDMHNAGSTLPYAQALYASKGVDINAPKQSDLDYWSERIKGVGMGQATSEFGGDFQKKQEDAAKVATTPNTGGITAIPGVTNPLVSLPAAKPGFDESNVDQVNAIKGGVQHIANLINAGKNDEAVKYYNDAQSKFGFTDDQLSKYMHHGNDPTKGNFTAEQIGAWKTPKAMAEGGIAQAFSQGGPTKPRYLRGETDGMADQIKARIDGGQEARLAHGEFVIPADVVSHLGNGNSDAGAKKLYAMMDKIRVARTGTKRQGRQINPDKFLPVKGMATGGITDAVQRFNAGGVTAGPSGLASWAAPYVTGMLSEANALGNNMVANPQNYVYQGPRAAGASELQTQGFNAAKGLGVNSNLTNAAKQVTGIGDQMKGMKYDATKFENLYKPADPYEATKFSSQEFTGDQVSKYMNPYLQQALDPQLAEARRQAEITRMTNAGRLVGSGAFGGGRQAIMEAEGDRNLGANLANITGQGYNTAYDKAMQQFNASQAQKLAADQATESSKQFGANFGMNNNVNSANFAQRAADATEASKQYGAKYGLDALQGAANVYNVAGGLGSQIGAQERANIASQIEAGNIQRSISQDALNAAMSKFNETAALPSKALQVKSGALQGLPITTTAAPQRTLIQDLSDLGLTAIQINEILGTP